MFFEKKDIIYRQKVNTLKMVTFVLLNKSNQKNNNPNLAYLVGK